MYTMYSFTLKSFFNDGDHFRPRPPFVLLFSTTNRHICSLAFFRLSFSHSLIPESLIQLYFTGQPWPLVARLHSFATL